MTRKYTGFAILMHWVLAVALFCQIGLGLRMGDIPKGDPSRAYWFNMHKSVGLVLAVLILVRIWWRAKNTPPPLPGSMKRWEVIASKASHHLLYLCMVVMPLSGYIGSNFTKYGVKFFGIPLAPWGTDDKNIYAVFNGIHEFCADVLIVVIVVHVLAAIKHRVIDRDTVFQRMLPGSAGR